MLCQTQYIFKNIIVKYNTAHLC